MDAQRGIARRMIVGLPPEGLSPSWERDFSAYPPAGVIVFARDFADLEGLRRLTRRLRELARPRRIFIAVDEEGGFVSQLAGPLGVPPNALLVARGSRAGDVEWLARVTGERLRALGLDWVFAPVADVHSRPGNPVIGPRAFGEDALTVTRLVGEALAGYAAAGVASCLKHFPGHGDTVLDSHLALPRCEAPVAELERRELAPFATHLRRVPSTMTAHVVYPALDADRPATFSPVLVGEWLRRRLGFQGLVVTDALEMKGAAEGRGATEAGRLALAAGCDLLLYAFHDEAVRRARLELARLLVDGGIERAGFDAARPRLAAFDQGHPEPTEAELARSLETLTPPDWESRLEAIVERGLVIRGERPRPAGTWKVVEPDPGTGPALADELARLGVPLDPAAGEREVIAVRTRKPLSEPEVERLREGARERPTVLVGLANDTFLDRVPEAVLRISAADATPATRRVVARVLAETLGSKQA